uniref:Uncharacterized protein n=1 Tax=Rhizophora mucronata TaxID=61149 RepID=A0A2P2N2D0_RHIMU
MPFLGDLMRHGALTIVCGGDGMWCHGLLAGHNLEGAFTRGFALLEIVGKLSHVEYLGPILLMGTYIVPQI